MEDELEFSDPPEISGQQRIDWNKTARQLKARPNQWARLKEGSWGLTSAANIALRVNNGTIVAFRPAGSFRATARNKDLYICYVRRTVE